MKALTLYLLVQTVLIAALNPLPGIEWYTALLVVGSLGLIGSNLRDMEEKS